MRSRCSASDSVALKSSACPSVCSLFLRFIGQFVLMCVFRLQYQFSFSLACFSLLIQELELVQTSPANTFIQFITDVRNILRANALFWCSTVARCKLEQAFKLMFFLCLTVGLVNQVILAARKSLTKSLIRKRLFKISPPIR